MSLLNVLKSGKLHHSLAKLSCQQSSKFRHFSSVIDNPVSLETNTNVSKDLKKKGTKTSEVVIPLETFDKRFGKNWELTGYRNFSRDESLKPLVSKVEVRAPWPPMNAEVSPDRNESARVSFKLKAAFTKREVENTTFVIKHLLELHEKKDYASFAYKLKFYASSRDSDNISLSLLPIYTDEFIGSLDEMVLAQHIWSLGKMGLNSMYNHRRSEATELCYKLFDRILYSNANGNEFSLAMVGFARMQIQYKLLTDETKSALYSYLDYISFKTDAQGIGNVLQSLAKMNMTWSDIPKNVQTSLLDCVVYNTNSYSNQSSSLVLQALGKMDLDISECDAAVSNVLYHIAHTTFVNSLMNVATSDYVALEVRDCLFYFLLRL